MRRIERTRRSAKRSGATVAVLLLGLFATGSGARAAEWPPADPREQQATAVFDRSWAVGLRDVHDFADLQRAAGTRGRIETYDLNAPFPRVVYDWTGSGGKGRMRAFLYEDGGFAAIISPSQSTSEIKFNSFGGFTCPACDPAVIACGHRPSWIPHDVHWDTFDCESTLTGPMPQVQ